MATQTPDAQGRVPHRTNARGERFCNGCHRWLTVDSFPRSKNGSNGLAARCRPCENEHRRVTRAKRLLTQPGAYEATLAYARAHQQKTAKAEFRERMRTAQAAVATLRGAGLSWTQISERAGISRNLLLRVRTGEGQIIYASTAEKLAEAARRVRDEDRPNLREMTAAEYLASQPPKRRKYGNEPIEVDGVRFASQAEARRYGELRLLEREGEIAGLRCHPRYELKVNGHRVGRYTADFAYVETATGREVVEDVKSGPTRTNDYRLRKRLMLAVHGITITEVER